MMAESSEDVAAEFPVAQESREPDSNDNGALRSSGFVLVSDSGSEVNTLRQGGQMAPAGPPPPLAPPSSGDSSREHSVSPPSNPYRGHLPHLMHGYSHSQEAAAHGLAHGYEGGHGHSHEAGHGHSHEAGHGHSHEAGHGHSHDTCAEPAPLPAAFFTPSAPAPDAPLPNLSPPPPPAAAPSPPGGFPFPQYQLPQFQKSQSPPQPLAMERGGGPAGAPAAGGYHVGVSLGDVEPPSAPHMELHSAHGGSGGGGGGGGGFFSSLFGSELVHKVVEKTKSGMETVITTLDPGMKEYIMGGGDVNLVIASSDEMEGFAVREAFYTVFGKATVRIMPPQMPAAPQLFGAEAARQACLQQMGALRSSGMVPPDAALLTIASFLSEPTPGRWFVTEYLLLQDPTSVAGIDGSAPLECDAYSVALSVPASIVSVAKSGPQPFESVMAQHQLQQQQQLHLAAYPTLPMASSPVGGEWRQSRFGLTRRDVIGQAARLLARDYRDSSRGRFEPSGPVFRS